MRADQEPQRGEEFGEPELLELDEPGWGPHPVHRVGATLRARFDAWLAMPSRRTAAPIICAAVVATLATSTTVDHWYALTPGPANSRSSTGTAHIATNGEIAFATDQGVELLNPVSGVRRPVPGIRWRPSRDGSQSLSWSPDGHRLGYISNGTAAVHSFDDGTDTTLGRSLDPTQNRFAWSVDGATFVQSGADVVGGLAATEGLDEVLDVSWSVDGQRLAVIGRRDGMVGVYVSDARLANVHQVSMGLDDRDFGPSRIAWSPDGRRLACLVVTLPTRKGPLHEELVIADPDGGESTRLADAGIAMHSESSAVQPGLTWSPDSTQVAVVANYAGASDEWGVYLISLTENVRPLLVGPISAPTLAWQPVAP